jgi:cytoskeletal protein CcmA (bactofilin family)
VFRTGKATEDQQPRAGTGTVSRVPATPLTPSGHGHRPGPGPGPGPDAAEGAGDRKRLTVGPGITLSGEIADCDRLVVEGTVRVALHRVRAIAIAETGRFLDGRAEVEQAEVAGVYEGELTVRGRLLVRGTGRVVGAVRYGEVEVERGGRLSGSVEVLEAAPGPGPDRPALEVLDGGA